MEKKLVKAAAAESSSASTDVLVHMSREQLQQKIEKLLVQTAGYRKSSSV